MIRNHCIIYHDKDAGATKHGLGLNEVLYEAGDTTGWMKYAVGFVCDPDEGPDGMVRLLEQALRDARTAHAARKRTASG